QRLRYRRQFKLRIDLETVTVQIVGPAEGIAVYNLPLSGNKYIPVEGGAAVEPFHKFIDPRIGILRRINQPDTVGDFLLFFGFDPFTLGRRAGNECKRNYEKK